jgi:adenylylsulfate kinase-like enzyme
MVLWILGLSGAGKTTLAKLVVAELRKRDRNIVLLDGDSIRALFPGEVDHTIQGRRRNAERISALSKFLADQGIHVVAAVLSLFPEWQSWNRAYMADYAEVYLKVSLETLARRDVKNLYAPALLGEISNVVGIDIPFPEPAHADLVIENEIDLNSLDDILREILAMRVMKSIERMS